MPQFGAHAFIWAGEWTPEGAEKVIRGASEAGLDFVENIIGATALWRDVVGDPRALITDGLAFLRDRAAEHGLLEGSAGTPGAG